VEAAEKDVDRALDLRSDFAAAHMLKGRILEERGEASAARERFQKALDGEMDSFDGRAARRLAKARLTDGDRAGSSKPEKSVQKKSVAKADVAEVNLDKPRPLDCKVFLPATGSVVTAKCSEQSGR
jgi:Flp pilus assembly protein TadD